MKPTISAHKRDMILKWHAAGYNVTETARLLHIPEQAVIDTINAYATPSTPATPDAHDVPLF